MKLNKHHIGALTAFIALTLAACGGGGNSTPAPSGTPPAPLPGPLALLSGTQNVQVPSTNGVTGVVSIPGGTGTVNVAVGSTPPAGSVALTSVARVVEAKTLATGSDSPLVYIAITASSTATLKGVPGMTLNLPAAPSGSVFEALWNGAQWITVGSAGTLSGNTVTLTGSSTAQTVTPGAPLYLVAYIGVTQSGVSSNVIVDGGFETEGVSGFAGATNGWAQCSYTHVNAESTSPPATPNPAVSPAKITAVFVSPSSPPFTIGATPKPTATPVVTPAPSTAPVPNSGTYAVLTYTGTGANTTFGKSVAGANGICQTFVVPASGVLSMSVKEGGNETAGDGDQEATLFMGGISALAGAAPSPIPVFSELIATTPSQTATPAPYVVKGPFALTMAPPAGLGIPLGTTVTLFIGTYDNFPSNTFGEYLLVDDVSVTGFLPQP